MDGHGLQLRSHAGHPTQCMCSELVVLSSIPAVPRVAVQSRPASTRHPGQTPSSARSQTALLEPKNFIRVPMC